MELTALKSLTEYGVLGIGVIICLYWIRTQHKDAQKMRIEHTEERDQWRQSNEKLHEKTLEAINNNSKILSEISTLIRRK